MVFRFFVNESLSAWCCARSCSARSELARQLCVELAREFGAEQSHRYVNGILDNLARRTRDEARPAG